MQRMRKDSLPSELARLATTFAALIHLCYTAPRGLHGHTRSTTLINKAEGDSTNPARIGSIHGTWGQYGSVPLAETGKGWPYQDTAKDGKGDSKWTCYS
jgi:hypothetical protein